MTGCPCSIRNRFLLHSIFRISCEGHFGCRLREAGRGPVKFQKMGGRWMFARVGTVRRREEGMRENDEMSVGVSSISVYLLIFELRV